MLKKLSWSCNFQAGHFLQNKEWLNIKALTTEFPKARAFVVNSRGLPCVLIY